MSDTPTDLFLSLTPEKVLAAVEASGLRCNPVCYPLNSFENRVYEVELEDRSRIIAKFYRPGRWSRDQLLEEHQFLEDLYSDEIPVCPTEPFPDGSSLKQIDDIYYCLFARRGGRAPDELTDAQSERLGMLVARIHNTGARRAANHRVHINADTYVRDNLQYLQDHKILPRHLEGRYIKAAELIASIADARMKGVEVHRVHGDLHMGNLLLREDVFHVLDFDDMVVGPAVQDLWLIIPGRDAWARRQREAFLEGYTRFRDFDRRTLNLIEPLRGLRVIHYATWLARRWHDPIFPRTWPHFDSPDYWEDETRDLEDLAGLIVAEGDNAPPPPPENSELTNKDYFFDWEDN